VQDSIISMNMVAMTRDESAGHPHLAHVFDLRTLWALGTVDLSPSHLPPPQSVQSLQRYKNQRAQLLKLVHCGW
jgi:hypothetical protein